MVQIDAGDDGAVGIHNVDGIQSSPKAHLQNDHIQLGLGQHLKDGQGAELEISQANVASRLLNFGKGSSKKFG